MKIIGIKYICPFFDRTSDSYFSRSIIKALIKSKIPVNIQPINLNNIDTYKKEFKNGEENDLLLLINKEIDYNIVLIHSSPDTYIEFKEKDKINIGIYDWETTELYKPFVDNINKNLEAIFVPSQFNVEVFKSSGVTIPILLLPYCFDESDFEVKDDFSIYKVPKKSYKFYNISSYCERKNLIDLVFAYWVAFQNKEDVVLILKVNVKNDIDKSVLRNTLIGLKDSLRLDYYAQIRLVTDNLSRRQILGIHKLGDCFVSLSRGEGFGLATFEAICFEKPIISVNFGGITEYLNDNNCLLVKSFMCPVWGYGVEKCYTANQMWANPDVEDAISTMRYIYNNQQEADNRAILRTNEIKDRYNWEKSIKILIDNIEKL